jgi:hypothetical protein
MSLKRQACFFIIKALPAFLRHPLSNGHSSSITPLFYTFLMRNPKHQLSTDLAESLQANLGGLNEKHAKKLQKTVAKAALKVASKFEQLQDKERRAAKKKAESGQVAAPKKTVVRSIKPAAPAIAPKQPTATGRAPRRKAATAEVRPAAAS